MYVKKSPPVKAGISVDSPRDERRPEGDRGGLKRVEGALADGERGFFDGFTHRRMRVNGAREVFGAAAVLHVRHDLADQFAGAFAENLGAEDFIGLRVGDDFDVAFGGVVGEGAAVGGEVKFADVDREAGGFRGVFAEADRGDFGIGVNDGGNQVPVHVTGFACDPFGDGDAVFFGFVREHRARDHIAERPDAGDIGLEVRVDFDAFFLVELHAGEFEAEAVGERPTTDGDEDTMLIGTKFFNASYWTFLEITGVIARSLVANISV